MKLKINVYFNRLFCMDYVHLQDLVLDRFDKNKQRTYLVEDISPKRWNELQEQFK